MLSYIESSYLQGYSKHLGCYSSQVIRNSLVSKLVMDRESPRILRAPNGYGKSTLCFQYAEIMFGLKHVFWFDCEDVKFVRDLDSENILKGILKIDKSTSLVIFDNLIYLNSQRCEKFFNLVNELTNKKIEVLISYTPINSPENNIPKSFDCIGPEDLLLTSEELGHGNRGICRAANYLDNTESGNRYPAIGFKRGNCQSVLIENNYSQNLPLGLRFAIFVVLVCQQTSVEEVRGMLGKVNVNLLISYAQDYTHIGFNENKITTLHVAISDLVKIFSSDINLFALEFVDNKDSMFEQLIDICIQNNNISRAFEISRICCCDDLQISLLEQFYTSEICSFNVIEPCMTIISLLDNNGISLDDENIVEKIANFTVLNIELLALFAYNFLMLGDKNHATMIAYAILQKTKRKDIGLFCALLFYICGNKSDISNSKKIIDCFINLEYPNEKNPDILAVVSDTLCQLILNEKNKNQLSDILSKISACNNDFLSMLSCGLILYMSKDNLSLLYIDDIKRLVSACSKRILKNDIHLKSCADYFFLKNYCALSSSHSGLMKVDDDTYISLKQIFSVYENLAHSGISKIKNLKSGVGYMNSQSFESNINFSDSNHDSADLQMSAENFSDGGEVPILRVNLFSGFRLQIGDRQVPPDAYSRKKIKTLLTFLILESGRNISGTWLSKSLWPDQNLEGAMSNLNSLWVSTRKILKDKNGNCPYLERVHNEFSVNSKFVVSDINDIDFLYDRYTLSTPDPQLWIDIANEKMDVIKGELLPGESSNHYIVRKRELYKNKILEALICASERLNEIEFFREALWFARLAMDVDSTREDVYYAMMKTQYLAGSRSNAIQTYLACKKLIEEESQYPLSKKIKVLMNDIVNETV